jgi:hypothetical protein
MKQKEDQAVLDQLETKIDFILNVLILLNEEEKVKTIINTISPYLQKPRKEYIITMDGLLDPKKDR